MRISFNAYFILSASVYVIPIKWMAAIPANTQNILFWYKRLNLFLKSKESNQAPAIVNWESEITYSLKGSTDTNINKAPKNIVFGMSLVLFWDDAVIICIPEYKTKAANQLWLLLYVYSFLFLVRWIVISFENRSVYVFVFQRTNRHFYILVIYKWRFYSSFLKVIPWNYFIL